MELSHLLTWPATCLPDRCFCEHVSQTWIRQPANTWSSFAFVAVGLWLFRTTSRELPGLVRVAYPSIVVAIGLTSALFHASLTFVGQWLDVTSMYAYAALLTNIHLTSLRLITQRAAAWSFTFVTFVSAVLAAVVPTGRRIVFDVLLIVAAASLTRVALTIWRDISRAPLALAVVAFAVAMAAWVLDNSHVWCTPTSSIQGHAAWHVLGALATAGVFAYYRAGFARTAPALKMSASAHRE